MRNYETAPPEWPASSARPRSTPATGVAVRLPNSIDWVLAFFGAPLFG